MPTLAILPGLYNNFHHIYTEHISSTETRGTKVPCIVLNELFIKEGEP